eukprot:10213617-Alexandrium_andersonii.AAC.1
MASCLAALKAGIPFETLERCRESSGEIVHVVSLDDMQSNVVPNMPILKEIIRYSPASVVKALELRDAFIALDNECKNKLSGSRAKSAGQKTWARGATGKSTNPYAMDRPLCSHVCSEKWLRGAGG